MRYGIFILFAMLAACQPRKDAAPWQRNDVLKKIVEPADPLDFVPATARWCVTVNSPAAWLDPAQNDPLIPHLWKVIQEYQPPELWKRTAEKLGMTDEQLVPIYFGQAVAVTGMSVADDYGVVVMTRAEEADLLKLPAAMGLTPADKQRKIGPFRLYTAKQGEKEFAFAIGQKWLCITDGQLVGHLHHLLTAVAMGGEPLHYDKPFNEMVSKLPEDREALMFARNPDNDEHHALVVQRDGGGTLNIEYVARTKGFLDMTKDAQRVEGVDFGPMPDRVIFAMTMNVLQNEPPGTGAFNMFLFPKSFNRHVRPGISPPMILFLSSIPGERVVPNPGMTVPVMGLAIRLANPAVAADLDRVMHGMHFLMSSSRLNLVQGFFGVKRVAKEGVAYQIADFGPVIQRMFGDDEFGRMARLPGSAGLTKVTFGRVGDYYLICSQEAFFHDWAKAQAAASSVGQGGGVTGAGEFQFENKPRPIASAMVRAPQLSALLNEVSAYWAKAQLTEEEKKQVKKNEEERKKMEAEKQPGEDFQRPLRWVTEGLQHRQSFSLQLWNDESGLVRGTFRSTPRNPK